MRALRLLLLLLGFVAIQVVANANDPFEDSSFESSQDSLVIGRKSIDLKEMLETGLRARRPEEFAFLSRIVRMVELGQLPEELVRSTFAWARHKRPYPLPFFERAIKLRAARIGIVVT